MNIWDEISFAPQGWQCPVCKRVFSPSTPWCYFCGGGEEKMVTTTNVTVSGETQGMVECSKCGHLLQKDWNWCPWCRWEMRRNDSND